MKDTEKLKNYRLKYKRHYHIDFDSGYDIHHIDGNHENNDIDNLLLLPKELHARYHMLINELGGCDAGGNIKFNVRVNMLVSNNGQLLEKLGATLRAINKWALYKIQLDMHAGV